MPEILQNTGARLWSLVDDFEVLRTSAFEELTGIGGKSNIRLIDEAIGNINSALDGYYFLYENDRLYICKDGESSTDKLPISLVDSNGHIAATVDGTSITIDEYGVIHGTTADDAFSSTSENAIQNKVVTEKFNSVEAKVSANETTIQSHTTALATLNGEGEGSVKKTVTDEIAKVVADAPESLDTLKEISDWISSHESDASAMNSAIQTNKTDIATLQTDKVDKETGKSLLADADKANYDDAVSKAHTHDNKSVLDGITSDKVTAWDAVNNKVDKVDGKGLSTNDYTTPEKTIVSKLGESSEGTLTFNGSEIKTNSDVIFNTIEEAKAAIAAGEIEEGASVFINSDTNSGTVDNVLSLTSLNPVQNKVITEEINNINSSLNGMKFSVSENGCLVVTYDDGTN